MAKNEEWNDIAALTGDIAIPTNNISAATVGDTTYTVVDVRAREVALDNRYRIDELKNIVEGGVNYKGKTTSELSDTSTTNPVNIITDAATDPVTTAPMTAVQGDMVSMANPNGGQDIEFIFNGTAWYELGSTGSLKSFAFVDTGTAEVSGATINVNDVSSATFSQTNYEAGVEYSFNEITCTVTPGNGNVDSTGEITSLPKLNITGTANCVSSVSSETATVMRTASVTDGILSFGTTTVVSALTANNGDVALNASGSYDDTEFDTLGTNIGLTATGNMLTGVTVVGTPSADISLSSFSLSADITLGKEVVSKTISDQTITVSPAS